MVKLVSSVQFCLLYSFTNINSSMYGFSSIFWHSQNKNFFYVLNSLKQYRNLRLISLKRTFLNYYAQCVLTETQDIHTCFTFYMQEMVVQIFNRLVANNYWTLPEKYPNTGFFQVRIFRNLDWILVPIQENTYQKKLRICTIFTQWKTQENLCLLCFQVV